MERTCFLGKYLFISYNLNYLVNLFDTEYVTFFTHKACYFFTYNFFSNTYNFLYNTYNEMMAYNL